ncbi:hypothetical protein BCF46_0887 [Litoreibacter meonggei]|uniref:Uncharacterized protein n=1 Tax=Litoreibacter meonggei TaxID=1049199 RepID=A0A497X6B7_9RHOB|nr:hypothetical protein [Litoreibacter meonggei]RLJ60684.1 hypothetical protein BCF46_0887 [Litoreibacter meonggei]
MSTALSLGVSSSDSFIVYLSPEGARSYSVRSVWLVSGDMSNSYCFRAGRPIETIFVPEFYQSFLVALNAQALDDQTIELPDFEVSLPGVGVSGLRIERQPDGDEPDALRLSFHRYVGDVTRVLRFIPSAELKPATVRERIAVEVLRDIVSPIFDMMSLSEPSSRDILKSHSGAIEARLTRLTAQQEEIKFYTGLLKRYVAGCQQDAADLGGGSSDDMWPPMRHSAGR